MTETAAREFQGNSGDIIMIFSESERAVQCLMKKEKDPRKILAAQKQYYVPWFSPYSSFRVYFPCR
jgi:hypothetical protein